MTPEERVQWILAAKTAKKKFVIAFSCPGHRVFCCVITDSVMSILSKTKRKMRVEEKIDVSLYNTDGILATERRYDFPCSSAAYCIPGIKRNL